jgi:hypothetical protein
MRLVFGKNGEFLSKKKFFLNRFFSSFDQVIIKFLDIKKWASLSATKNKKGCDG